MTPLVNFILPYLFLYKYFAMFGVIFLAGSLFPLPINTILIAIGAFSNQGYFDLNTSFYVAVLANTCGDTLSHYFFRVFGRTIVKEKYVEKYLYFRKIEKYVETHPGLSIVVSRIVGIFGQPVNFLAGFTKVLFYKFLFFDLIGNILFAFIFLGVGYSVGDSWIIISSFVSTVMSAVFVVVLLGLIYIILKKDGGQKTTNK